MIVRLLFVWAVAVATAISPEAYPHGPPAELRASFADRVADLFAHKDIEGLRRAERDAQSVTERFMVRYRLFPLTDDTSLLANLPERSCEAAAECAMLSALWAFRLEEASAVQFITFARRSDRFLARARELDARDPIVLLVDGQNLMFRPAVFGGSASRALDQFAALRDLITATGSANQRVSGISRLEAEIWVWYALTRLGRSGTDAMRDRLLAENPAPIFREFLLDPS